MAKLPVEGVWAPQLKDYVTYEPTDYQGIVSFLTDKDFKIDFYYFVIEVVALRFPFLFIYLF